MYLNLDKKLRINRVCLCALVLCLFFFFLNIVGHILCEWRHRGEEGKCGHRRPNHVHLNTKQSIRLQDLLVASVDLAIQGGEEVVAVRNSGSGDLGERIKGQTKEGAKDRVTEGDYRSHRVMYYGFRKAFPEVKVISEEHTDNPIWNDVPLPSLQNDEITNSLMSDEMLDPEDVSVWIDPLDATQEYTENLLEYVTTMVCVAVKGRPIIGVIHKPFSKETYWSAVGHGSSLNLIQMSKRVNENPELGKKLRIVVSRSHTGKVQNYTGRVLGKDSDFEILKAAGAGYKVIEVIDNKADVYLHVTAIKKWDVCAGNAILSALGGYMTTVNGEILDYSSETNPLNVKGILAYMKSSPEIRKLSTIDVNQ